MNGAEAFILRSRGRHDRGRGRRDRARLRRARYRRLGRRAGRLRELARDRRVAGGGHEETYQTGDAYYAPPGHTPRLYAGSEVVEFDPTAELAKTIEVVERNMQTL
jgi:hypothetical protein